MNVNECLSAVEDWMDSNRVRLNNKTEFLWRTTSRRQHRLPATGPTIGSSLIKPFSVARDLGVFIDSDLSDCLALFQYATPAAVAQYPTATTDCCFIVTGRCNALVLSRLDYCNSLLAGMPANLIRRLQSVQNAAARLTVGYGAPSTSQTRSSASNDFVSGSASCSRSP